MKLIIPLLMLATTASAAIVTKSVEYTHGGQKFVGFLAYDSSATPEAIASYLKALDAGQIDYQFVNYAGALHAFTNPDATRIGQENGMSTTIGYNETAARRSWQQMKMFFDEIFNHS